MYLYLTAIERILIFIVNINKTIYPSRVRITYYSIDFMRHFSSIKPSLAFLIISLW